VRTYTYIHTYVCTYIFIYIHSSSIVVEKLSICSTTELHPSHLCFIFNCGYNSFCHNFILFEGWIRFLLMYRSYLLYEVCYPFRKKTSLIVITINCGITSNVFYISKLPKEGSLNVFITRKLSGR
jgi:hypothetical protein